MNGDFRRCPTCGGNARIVGDDSLGNTQYEHEDEVTLPKGHDIDKVKCGEGGFVIIHNPDCSGCEED